MESDIDHNYKYEYDKLGTPYFPEGERKNTRDLYVLPNGKLLEPGLYRDKKTGDSIIYEPFELSIGAELLANNILEE